MQLTYTVTPLVQFSILLIHIERYQKISCQDTIKFNNQMEWKYVEVGLIYFSVSLILYREQTLKSYFSLINLQTQNGHFMFFFAVDVLVPFSTTTISSSPTVISHFLDTSPDFSGPIQNVTAAVGREAVLICTVNDLGHYKVITPVNFSNPHQVPNDTSLNIIHFTLNCFRCQCNLQNQLNC